MIPQLLAHLWGDYILQSDWMAQNKTKRDWPAWCHAFVYSMCFWPILASGHVVLWGVFSPALAIIFGTHFLIDRYRLARYVVWAKNWMGPKRLWYRVRSVSGGPDYWAEQLETPSAFPVEPENFFMYWRRTPQLWACPTGMPPTVPEWLSVWLLIIADNTLHLTINYLALRYL